MTNYIRAQFCVEHPIRRAQFYRLLCELDRLGCKYTVSEQGVGNGRPELDHPSLDVKEPVPDGLAHPSRLRQLAAGLASPGFARISLGWQVGERQFQATLERWQGQSDVRGRISLNVPEAVFLEGVLEFSPGPENRVFSAFKQIVAALVAHTRPLVGAIDYEADLLCETLSQFHSIVSWGNFFSDAWLERWPAEDVQALRQVVDECIAVRGLGLLTFIHPLAANQSWTAHHREVDALLRRNRFDEETRGRGKT